MIAHKLVESNKFYLLNEPVFYQMTILFGNLSEHFKMSHKELLEVLQNDSNKTFCKLQIDNAIACFGIESVVHFLKGDFDKC